MDPPKAPNKLLFRTASYNLDGPHISKEKFALLLDTTADILCLTNVTEQTFNQLFDKLNAKYVAFQVFIEEGEDIGTVIMCNRNTTAISEEEQPYYFDYPSRVEGRVIGTGVVHLSSKLTFNILTADIDHTSEANRRVQHDTLTKVIADINGNGGYIVLGDVGHLCLPGQCRDVWTKMGCPLKIKSDRITRMYMDSRVLVPKSMSLIETKTKSPLGLETIFQINRRKNGL